MTEMQKDAETLNRIQALAEQWRSLNEIRNALLFCDVALSMSDASELIEKTYDAIMAAKDRVFSNQYPEDPEVSISYISLICEVSKFANEEDAFLLEDTPLDVWATILIARELMGNASFIFSNVGGPGFIDSEKRGDLYFYPQDLPTPVSADEDHNYIYNVHKKDFSQINEYARLYIP